MIRVPAHSLNHEIRETRSPASGRNQRTYFAVRQLRRRRMDVCEHPRFNFRKAGKQETRKQLTDDPAQIFLVSCLPAFLIVSWETLANHWCVIGFHSYLPRICSRTFSIGLIPRPAQDPAWFCAGKFAVLEDELAVDDHMPHALGHLLRFGKRSPVDDEVRIEEDD